MARFSICKCDPNQRTTELDCIVGYSTLASFEFCVACGNAVDLETCIIQLRARNARFGGCPSCGLIEGCHTTGCPHDYVAIQDDGSGNQVLASGKVLYA